MSKALTILFVMICQVAWSQQNAASIGFFNDLNDCAASLGGWKCLELDLSSEGAAGNDSSKVYEYSGVLATETENRAAKLNTVMPSLAPTR